MDDLDRRLRAALASLEPDPATGDRIRSAVMRDLTTARRGRTRRMPIGRIARVGMAAVGLVAVGGLMVALFLSALGGNATAPVTETPRSFSILDRAQTPAEAAVRIPARLSLRLLAPSSLRIAQTTSEARYLVGRNDAGQVCVRRDATRGGFAEQCLAPSEAPTVTAWRSDTAQGDRGVFGLAPDGVSAVIVNGRRVIPEGNVFQSPVDPAASSVGVDFLAGGVTIDSWHHESPQYPVSDVMFSEPPRLGVACPIANDPSCDRVGLAVWLREPARAVRARLDGRWFALDDPQWSGAASGGLRRMFAGFLHPAGLASGALHIPHLASGRWEGYPEVSAPVTIEVTRRDGRRRVVTLEVRLSPGWG